METQKSAPVTVMDSYQEFLRYFHMEKQDFFEWGISSTIFPPVQRVEEEWKALKKRILNHETVYIRGYGRDAHATQLYIEFYRTLLGNTHVEKDATNNAVPQRLIQEVTGLKRNRDIYNYQVSHIWGRTKNVFLFSAPWNICYTPKIMDPFTGHETQGAWPAEYQRLFLARARELYRSFVEEYNQLIRAYSVEEHLVWFCQSLKGKYGEKELVQFARDATQELSPIE